jgi:putative transposase
MMKSKFTDRQIMDAVKRVEAGFAVPDFCRAIDLEKKW